MPNSPWTETGSSISLVPSTTTIGSDPENVNYLSNQDKINLMAQYTAELAMKTSLDTLASTWSVSSTFYDNAVAAISTALINAGAPANWATTWPDGTTSGPWPNIQTSLANLWAQVATQRTALQSVISNAQAAAAQTAAIAAAATDATNKMNAAITAVGLAPVVVSSLPTLPSATYPSGRLVWNTADGQLYRSTGSAWTALTVSAPDISGTLTAAQIASVAASQVTGQLSDSQIAAIGAAKLTGQITGTQISNGAISTPQLAAGAVTAATIAADTITASQIAAGAITASELAAGAVVAGKIAAGTIQAGDIAAATITGDRIAANTITTTQIAANTITASDIAANTITAGCIAAGAIGATQIAAGAITTSSLTVANFDNLIPNPNSSMSTPQGAAWAAGSYEATALQSWGSVYALTPVQGFRGIVGNGAGQYVSIAGGIPCNPGDQFYFECYGATNDNVGSKCVQVSYRSLGDGYLADYQTNTITYNGSGLSDGNPPKLSIVLPPAPSGAASIRVWLVNNGGTSGSMTFWNRFYLRRMADANLIVDGTVTASKIAAGAITADMITTGTLNAANVAVTNLNASNITTGTLSANMVLFPDGSALTTASRIVTAKVSSTSAVTTTGTTLPGVLITGLNIPAGANASTAASAHDTFNLFGNLEVYQTTTVSGALAYINLYVDGVFNQSILISVAGQNQISIVPFVMTLTGLAAGTHNFQFYASSNSPATNVSIAAINSSVL
jgi:hypothetical protein